MTESALSQLQRLLITRYGELKTRLTRRLGSEDLASEALQDTWLRLQGEQIAMVVHSPEAYLFRTAVNAANDRRRAEARRLTRAEVASLLTVPDDAPEPDRVLTARQELEDFAAILAELPPRQRAILLAARLQGLQRNEIAARYGISKRMVLRELAAAQDYCAARLRRTHPNGFTFGTRQTSTLRIVRTRDEDGGET
jgi:RNA polymerase sigma-70 factor (ECF subfamily)